MIDHHVLIKVKMNVKNFFKKYYVVSNVQQKPQGLLGQSESATFLYANTTWTQQALFLFTLYYSTLHVEEPSVLL